MYVLRLAVGMDGEITIRLLNTIVIGGVLGVAWILFEPVWKGVRNMMTQAEWDAAVPPEEFKHVGIPMDCLGCDAMVTKHKFTWLECTQAHWRTVVDRAQAVKALPLNIVPDVLAAPKNLMEVGFRHQYKWEPEPEKVAEVFRVKKKFDIMNVSDGKGDLS